MGAKPDDYVQGMYIKKEYHLHNAGLQQPLPMVLCT